MLPQKTKWHLPFLIGLGALLYLPGIGQLHLFDWDEINFAESAREMILSRDYLQVQINFLPFWEKPPLFIWLQVFSMKLFGINEFAARLPNALFGILSLVTIYKVGTILHHPDFGLRWAILFGCSVLPLLYFKSGIIDPVFNYFMITSLLLLLVHNKSPSSLKLIASGISLGMAVLTKGPAALLLIGGTLFFAHILNIFRLRTKEWLVWSAVTMIVSVSWYAVLLWQKGIWFAYTFIAYQIRLITTEDAGHGGFLLYHFLVVLACFPASLFFFRIFQSPKDYFDKVMLLLLAIVLLVFTVVETKIVHYSSLAYYPISFLGARHLSEKMKVYEKWGVYLITSLLFIFLLFLPLLGNQLESLSTLISEPFMREALGANVQWGYDNIAYLLAFLLITYFIWRFNKGFLPVSLIASLMVPALFLCHLYYGVNEVEGYSQKSNVDFFKEMAGKDVYCQAIGYKSYVPFFYGQKVSYYNNLLFEGYLREKKGINRLQKEAIPPNTLTQLEIEWLLYGKIDKPAYFSCRVDKEKYYKDYSELKQIGKKNGFIFYRRDANTTY